MTMNREQAIASHAAMQARSKAIGDRPSTDLTFRDQLIAAALQGLLSNPNITTEKTVLYEDGDEMPIISSLAAMEAVEQADRVLRSMASDEIRSQGTCPDCGGAVLDEDAVEAIEDAIEGMLGERSDLN